MSGAARRPLVFVGAGGFTRETIELVRSQGDDGPWRLMGILDDDPARHGTEVAGLPVLGPAAAVTDHPEAGVVVGVGSPRNFVARAQIVERLAIDDDRYATLVHPAAVVAATCRLGAGSVVHAGCVFTADVLVGRHVAVMPGVVLTHDDVVGDYATFASGVRVGGSTVVGEGAYVGAGAVIREGTTIGPWSLVGAGAVVIEDVPAGEVWVGNPARRLRDVDSVGDLTLRVRRRSS